MKQLTDFILEIPDVISEDLSKTIIDHVPLERWEKGTVNGTVFDETKRKCDVAVLWGSEYDEDLFNVVVVALNRYKEVYPEVLVATDSGYELLRYGVGGHLVQHVDSYDLKPRVLSMSLTLNEDYEGGEWSFFGGEYVIKPKAGSALVFPSNFMYPHGILPITKGTRYSIITWFT